MLTVSDIMSTEVYSIRSSSNVTRAIAQMQAKQVQSLVVEKAVQSGAYGIITERDIVYKVTAKAVDPDAVMVCEIMTSPCFVVSSGLSVFEVAKQFLERELQRAPVIQDGFLVGMISLSDIILKSNIEAVKLPESLSQQAETAIRHQQLCWGDADDIAEESEAVYNMLEMLRPDREGRKEKCGITSHSRSEQV